MVFIYSLLVAEYVFTVFMHFLKSAAYFSTVLDVKTQWKLSTSSVLMYLLLFVMIMSLSATEVVEVR